MKQPDDAIIMYIKHVYYARRFHNDCFLSHCGFTLPEIIERGHPRSGKSYKWVYVEVPLYYAWTLNGREINSDGSPCM